MKADRHTISIFFHRKVQNENKLRKGNMMNRWELTNEIRDKYGFCVKNFLEQVDKKDKADDLKEIDLSDSGFNPYTLWKYMEELGYEKGTQDDNGWELDFWIACRSIWNRYDV